ncbi:MAG TPA: hypothetical protein VM802_09940 [Chitinophaga sp.]|uniref:hypothetical protein n=1 Tax=Chitinophaga sp. TaxID=1869181 RepID=UPI002B9ED099|nr:hypothetical protein [Chitinophaga sp.]HVI45184.1 hypothetical protein [Chitinophaga sp.]
MIRELSNFVTALDPHFKSLGIKPREGLHILLRIQKQEGRLYMDDTSLVAYGYTRKKDQTPEDIAFLKQCAGLSRLSWNVDINKCLDVPAKVIHSCSPYCVAIKRESLTGGEKYRANEKSQVYERMNIYFSKAVALLDDEAERQEIKVFEDALGTEDRFNHWLGMVPEYADVKDGEYVIFYLDVAAERYEKTNDKYLADKLFNTSEYNQEEGEDIYGTSNFFNGFPTKKRFLIHQSAYFDVSLRISSKTARDLFDFQEIIRGRILPNPLPIFIHDDELIPGKNIRDSSIALFKKGAADGERIGYREIIETLYEEYKAQLGNYYLLFYERGVIKDFDFVPKFEYLLENDQGGPWEVNNWFNVAGKAKIRLQYVFELQTEVLLPVFNNALVVRTKSDELQYRYFDEIDARYCKSEAVYVLIMQYRKSFYDFIYKSERTAVTQHMFDHIIQTSILEDIRLDEIKNGYHSQERSIREKMNIWFSLSHHFNLSHSNETTMTTKLQDYRAFMQKLAEGTAHIETGEQYAFVAGQVIYYLFSKSRTADRSFKRLTPFIQQVHVEKLNEAISRLVGLYAHEVFSNRFKTAIAEVLAFQSKDNIRKLTPVILSGVFSDNELFSRNEASEVIEPEMGIEE